MNSHRHPVRPTCATVAALVVAVSLAACNSGEQASVGQKVDTAIADVKAGAGEAKVAAKEVAADVGVGVKDAAITTRLSAALAADSKLSALRIDVDTRAGRVVLSGAAPDAVSREHATTLAHAVEGVVSVDNRLNIGK